MFKKCEKPQVVPDAEINLAGLSIVIIERSKDNTETIISYNAWNKTIEEIWVRCSFEKHQEFCERFRDMQRKREVEKDEEKAKAKREEESKKQTN